MAIGVPLIGAFNFDCKWAELGEMNRCYPTELEIASPIATITSVNNATTPTSYEALIIEWHSMHYFPKGIGKFFPQLTRLEVLGSGLKSIQAADLEGLDSLKNLNILSNGIEKLSGDLFKFTPKLTDIRFTSNKINRVGKDLLKNLHFLEFVTFVCNKCINSKATSNFEAFNNELHIKCADPMEVEQENCPDDLKRYKSDIGFLQEEIKRNESSTCLRQDPSMLLDWNDLVEKRSAKLAECEKKKIID